MCRSGLVTLSYHLLSRWRDEDVPSEVERGPLPLVTALGGRRGNILREQGGPGRDQLQRLV